MTAPGAGLERPDAPPTVARVDGLTLRYGRRTALEDVSLGVPAGVMAGLIGPDGVGKSSLLAVIAGARAIKSGQAVVLGGDMRNAGHRRRVCPRIAYMPQGLGKNLYATLSVRENVDFFGRLFGHDRAERERRIADLLTATGLAPFADRPAGKLSGGMKQKLGLCCALIHDPDLLILDEPTTGVDPLSRRQFWALVERMRASRPGMSVLVATAYMEEASQFDWLAAMEGGRVLASGAPQTLLERTGAETLEAAFVALLPDDRRRDYRPVEIPPFEAANGTVAIEAEGLTMRFGDFTAVDRVGFRIRRGEIFGFLGSNGCGKTTTMKMLTGLLIPSEGRAELFGQTVKPNDLAIRRRVGYMSQNFSLYGELTVRQNLALHARLFGVPDDEVAARAAEMVERFDLAGSVDALPNALPLGRRQRLSLAVAMIHRPEMLILDEPTSGVDPVARDAFWRILIELSRRDRVTIFISTHFMNEAARCDRISLMHAGKVLVSGAPEALVAESGAADLDACFVGHLEKAVGEAAAPPHAVEAALTKGVSGGAGAADGASGSGFHLGRMLSYARREALELRRDPIRLTLAMLGSIILFFVMGYGISLDIEDLSYAVLDRDQTTLSRDYRDNLSGSRYFVEGPPITSYAELDERMRSGELSMAVEIPSGFARDVARGEQTEIGAWFDGAMPTRAETARGYIQGIHAHWMTVRAREAGYGDALAAPAEVIVRFRYNPDMRSLDAMAPAVMPLLLLMIPAMLATLSVAREKELGTIVNFYVTPVSRIEFLLGKQLPYLALAMLNAVLLTLQAVFVFDVAITGSLLALLIGSLLYVWTATGFGLLFSTFLRSQIAAIFGTAVLTMLPAVSFSGLTDPVSSLEGAGRVIGEIYPTSYFIMISRGVFSKALGLGDLAFAFAPLAIAGVVLLAVSVLLLEKQEA